MRPITPMRRACGAGMVSSSPLSTTASPTAQHRRTVIGAATNGTNTRTTVLFPKDVLPAVQEQTFRGSEPEGLNMPV